MKKVIKTYYANLQNMGDLLNELLIRDVFNQELKRHNPASSELSCIGSGMDCFMSSNRVYPAWYSMALRARSMFTPWENNVWCTGFIFKETQDRPFIRKMNFRAVRGEMTKSRVEKIIGKKLDIPTGDGGILAPYLFSKPIPKKHAVGVIAHFHEQEHPAFKRVLEAHKDSVFINLRDDPLTVVRQIAECEIVISSSLHGLIVADSFGIPSQWIEVTDVLKGDGFKFYDYYSAFGVVPTPILMGDASVPAPTVNHVIDNYKIDRNLMLDKQKQIYNAFPFRA